MAGLLEWLSNQKDSAANDYADLMSNYPNAQKFSKGLINAISEHVPSNADFKSPEAMRDWATAAALNAPMGLTFIGKNAANWNPVKAAEAEKLLNAGVDPAQVWKEHLIGRMPDNSLFSEIDDSKQATQGLNMLTRALEPEAIAQGAPRTMPSWVWMDHPELFDNYPHTGNTMINPTSSIESQGSFDPMSNILNLSAFSKDPKSTTLHEFQHAIQEKEGWARGGSPDNPPLLFMDEINKIREEKSKLNFDPYAISNKITSGYYVPEEQLLKYKKWEGLQSQEDDLLSQAKKITPMQAYRRLTGEAQARATQDRMNMNMQQRRDTYPLAGGLLSDIPLDQLINRYRDN